MYGLHGLTTGPDAVIKKIMINWWSTTRSKSRVLRRLQFYVDFEILLFKRFSYSLQSHCPRWTSKKKTSIWSRFKNIGVQTTLLLFVTHSPHWMDRASFVYLKAENECTEFSLFQTNISNKSDLESFYSNWYVGFFWCTHHSVFCFTAGGGANWNPLKGVGQGNLIFFCGRGLIL